MAALPLTVELELDRRSAASVANEAQQAMSEASRTISRDFSRSMSGATSSAGRDMDALRGRVTGVTNQMISLGGHLADVDRTTVGLGQRAVTSFGGMGTAAMTASIGVAAIGTAALVVGKQLYDVGAQWDNIADGITVRTGAVGDSLTALTDAVGDIGSTTAASLDSIGDIVGQLSQAMPGIVENNGALRQMGSNLAYLSENGQAVNIRELGMAFNVFGVNAASAVPSLDALNSVSQKTGIPINDLISTVRQGAPQFKQFGLDLSQATGLLASFSRAGLEPGAAVTGLRFALKNVGDDARGAAPALADVVTQIKAFHDANNEGSALQLAQDTFGGKNFGPFLEAIETGTLDANNLKDALDDVGLSVKDMQDATDDGAQGWQKLSNTIKTEVAPEANKFFTFVNNEVMYLTGHLTEATDQLQALASVPITADSALGKMLLPGGGLPGMPGVAAPNGIGSSLSPAGAGLVGPNGLLAPTWGTHNVPGLPFDKGSSSNPKLPDAPVVPYDSTLPRETAGLPQTAEIYGAETSFMDARHTLAEKQARLNQLEQTNVATAEDIQKADNDRIQAQQALDQAHMRLIDASTKRMKDQTGAMEQLGAKIDDDFGVSKGLAGIAENLTKFLANLAFAPVFGALEAVKKSDGFDKDSGSGLLGMLGNSGAFGAQFTPEARAAAAGSTTASPSTLGPGGVQQGVAGTAMPGESARDFAHRVMMPFWQNQGFQVGDHGADKYGEHQNGAVDIMVPSIAEGSKVLQQVLSDPNVYGAIFNQRSYGYGHGTAGTPMGDRGSPTENHQDHVHAWYKPGDPGDIKPTGAAGPFGVPGAPGGYQQGATPFGSIPLPLPVTIVGGMPSGGAPPGAPASGQGSGAPPGPGGSANWDAIAGAESGGNWAINSGNGFSGGLQFSPSTWSEFGGGQFAPQAWQASPEQQKAIADRVLAGQGTGAWPATSSAHPEWFAPGWQGPGVPTGMTGGGGQGPTFGSNPQGPGMGNTVGGGLGSGPAAPGGTGGAGDFIGSIPSMAGGAAGPPGLNGVPSGVPGGQPGAPGGTGGTSPWGRGGAAPSSSVAGGRSFGQGLPASSGLSFSGGIIGAAASMAASGASMGMGGGAGADLGIQLIGRAIGAGGQYAGNAVGGLLETFALNDSSLADPGKSWFGRLAIAGAGMRPALPNSAGALGGEQNKAMAEGGKPPPPALTPQQAEAQAAAGGAGAAAGKGGDTVNNNISVTNNRATEDGTGKDIQAHLGATQASKQGGR